MGHHAQPPIPSFPALPYWGWSLGPHHSGEAMVIELHQPLLVVMVNGRVVFGVEAG